MKRILTKKGFTLIDTVIYIALYAVLIGSVTMTVYSLYTSNNRNQTHVLLVEEANFLQAKISWIISQAQIVTLPLVNTSDTVLRVIPTDTTLGNLLSVQQNTNALIFTRGSSTRTLSNPDIIVHDLLFTYASTTGTGASLKSILFSFTLSARAPDGKVIMYTVSHTQYIRI
jgi:hypothetical protein